MFKKGLLAALAALMGVWGAQGQVFRVQGTVRDSLTRETLENAVVELTGGGEGPVHHHTGYTDARGRFAVVLSAGIYRVTVRTMTHAPLLRELRVAGDSDGEYLLVRQPVPLGEVEVSSLRVNRRVRELPLPMAVVGAAEFRKLPAQTLAGVLAAEPGIALGRDGIWSTTINIRGLNESRLVTLIDGHRVETATDLTASLSLADANDIERVEVVKGAQSSLYGTGAMGGIVNIITRDGHFSGKPYLNGSVTAAAASANGLYSGHGSLSAGAEKWYLRVSGTLTAAGDMQTPAGRIPNSRFSVGNYMLKGGLRPLENHRLRLQYQNNRGIDVGIPGGEAFPGPATATYTNISRHLLSGSYEISGLTESLASLKLSYFTQYIERDVEMIPNTPPTETKVPAGVQRVTPTSVVPVGNHLTHGAQLQGTWTPGSRNTLIAGADVWSRAIRTERTKYIKNEVVNSAGEVVKTTLLERGETPIPPASFGSGGLFVQDEARLPGDRVVLIAGGRIDVIRVENGRGYDVDYLVVNGTRNDSPPNQRITFEEGTHRNLSWSANTGLLYKVTGETDLSLNLARSFRAPSLEELFKYIDLGNFVRLGDPALKPESGWSGDLGLRIWKPRFNLQVNGFVNRISNMVVETPGEFIYTVSTGAAGGTTDTLPALVNANVSRALLYGADAGMQYNVTGGLVLFATGSLVIGRDTESDASLPRVPPHNGRLGVRWGFPAVGTAELSLTAAARQERIAEGEKATEGFTRYDAAFSSRTIRMGGSRLQLFAGIENLTDRLYTNHLSTNRGGVSVEPGRNFYLRLSLAF